MAAAMTTPSPSPSYALTVDGVPVPRPEFDRRYRDIRRQYEGRFRIDFATEDGKAADEDIKRGLIALLFERQLVLNEAKRLNVEVSEADVAATIANIKRGFPNEDQFEYSLRQSGTTLDDLRALTRENRYIENAERAIGGVVVVPDQEIEDYYRQNLDSFREPEEVRASHILFGDQALAADVLARLQQGSDFAELAQRYSQDPGSAQKGGDLGFFQVGRMIPEFERVAFSLQPGQLSGLVKTQFGFHIIKVTDRHNARMRAFDEVKDEIKERLTRDGQARAFGAWLQAAKRRAVLVLSPDLRSFAPERPAGQ